jgi:hypothetical protein
VLLLVVRNTYWGTFGNGQRVGILVILLRAIEGKKILLLAKEMLQYEVVPGEQKTQNSIVLYGLEHPPKADFAIVAFASS